MRLKPKSLEACGTEPLRPIQDNLSWIRPNNMVWFTVLKPRSQDPQIDTKRRTFTTYIVDIGEERPL